MVECLSKIRGVSPSSLGSIVGFIDWIFLGVTEMGILE
jgi:hypothetical protein